MILSPSSALFLNQTLTRPGSLPSARPKPVPTPHTWQGFQDLGAKDVAEARQLLYSGAMRMEGRTQAAQKEGGVHDMVSYERKPW